MVAAIESANVPWSEITPVYLAPADAAAAFARGAIDAWAIWDPFYAIAETQAESTAVADRPECVEQNSFFLANSDFIAQHADVVTAINEEIAKATKWAGEHRDETAALFSEASGVEIEAQKKAVDRTEFTFGALDDKIIAQQQACRRPFPSPRPHSRAVAVRDIVWTEKSNS